MRHIEINKEWNSRQLFADTEAFLASATLSIIMGNRIVPELLNILTENEQE